MLLLKRDAQMKVKVHPKITECKGITFNKKTQYDQQDYIDCFNLFYAEAYGWRNNEINPIRKGEDSKDYLCFCNIAYTEGGIGKERCGECD